MNSKDAGYAGFAPTLAWRKLAGIYDLFLATWILICYQSTEKLGTGLMRHSPYSSDVSQDICLQ